MPYFYELIMNVNLNFKDVMNKFFSLHFHHLSVVFFSLFAIETLKDSIFKYVKSQQFANCAILLIL